MQMHVHVPCETLTRDARAVSVAFDSAAVPHVLPGRVCPASPRGLYDYERSPLL